MIPTVTLRSKNRRSVKRPSTHLQLSVLSLSLMSSFFLSSASGAEINPTLLYKISGEEDGARFGIGMASLDDVDGDGYRDLAIGENTYPYEPHDPDTVLAPVADRICKIRVVSGLNGRTLSPVCHG